MDNNTITAERLTEIFEIHGAYLISDETEGTVKQCNDNGAKLHCGLDAEGWAVRIAHPSARV